jgi:hypothetical protein
MFSVLGQCSRGVPYKKESFHITVGPEMSDFIILPGRLRATINTVTV